MSDAFRLAISAPRFAEVGVLVWRLEPAQRDDRGNTDEGQRD